MAYVIWGYAGTGEIGFACTHNCLDPVLAGSLVAWLLRALAFVGISSYSTYLWHWPFATLLTRRFHLDLGAVSFHLIEKPAFAWRRARTARQDSISQRSAAIKPPASWRGFSTWP